MKSLKNRNFKMKLKEFAFTAIKRAHNNPERLGVATLLFFLQTQGQSGSFHFQKNTDTVLANG